jgi:hypothetical protein
MKKSSGINLALALLAVSTASIGLAQEVTVARESAKGKSIAVLNLPPTSTYQSGSHTITPSLEVYCSKKGKKYERELYFIPGTLLIGNPMSYQFLSIGPDRDALVDTTWSYSGMESSYALYRYEGPAGTFFKDARRLAMIQSLFEYKKYYVRFLPMLSNPVVMEFNMSGLREAFLAQPECSGAR